MSPDRKTVEDARWCLHVHVLGMHVEFVVPAWLAPRTAAGLAPRTVAG